MTKATLEVAHNLKNLQIPKISLPKEFLDYVHEKVEKNGRNGKGGRPHFLQQIASKDIDPQDELLFILERAWLRLDSPRKIARHYGTTYQTIWRILQDLKPYKRPIADYLTFVPRRKTFFNMRLQTSDYETVRNYIKRAKRDGLRTWKGTLRLAMKAWKFFNYANPAKWTSFEVAEFLATKPESTQCKYLVTIRQIAPQIGEGGEDELSVARYSELQGIRKKDVFGNEVELIRKPLREKQMSRHLNILDLHITVGAREGTKGEAGMCFMKWEHLKNNFTRVDDYETKVKGGIWWRDCPTDLFFRDLPERLNQMWIDQGKPINQRILGEKRPYYTLLQIYGEIRETLAEYYKDKLDPHTYQEITTIRPHDADKIHVNLLWEAEIPLEVVAGKYLGKGEGIGLMGRGWLTLDVVKKHYLSLTQRSKQFRKMKRKLEKFSAQFNCHAYDMSSPTFLQ